MRLAHLLVIVTLLAACSAPGTPQLTPQLAPTAQAGITPDTPQAASTSQSYTSLAPQQPSG